MKVNINRDMLFTLSLMFISLATIADFFEPKLSTTLLLTLVLSLENRTTYFIQALYLSYSHYLAFKSLSLILLEDFLWLAFMAQPIKEGASFSTKSLLLSFAFIVFQALKFYLQPRTLSYFFIELFILLFFYFSLSTLFEVQRRSIHY